MGELKPGWRGAEGILNRLMEIARACALSEMASGIAHELNQPLGAIATFSQAGDRLLNRAEPMVGRALEVFRQINTEALQAGEGIRRIRTLFDQAEPERTPTQLPELLEELRPVLDVIAECAGVEYRVTVQPLLPAVSIDTLRVQHVIFALMQNALDSCAAGASSPRVTIDVRADRYAVETSVIDSGPGIAEHLRDQVFRPFFTTKTKGTGLGLASCRAIIESHEGTIGYEGTAGNCRFWFRLPIT